MSDEEAAFEQLKARVMVSTGFEQMASTGTEYKTLLEAAGFSPTMAEQIAAHFLMEQQAAIFRQVSA